MPTARGYVRVSTEEQAVNGVSIDAQKEILQAYAVVKGYTDFKIYTDEGFSGKNLNRPDVQRLLEECRSGKVEAVIVWRLDRLSRSLRDTLRAAALGAREACGSGQCAAAPQGRHIQCVYPEPSAEIT